MKQYLDRSGDKIILFLYPTQISEDVVDPEEEYQENEDTDYLYQLGWLETD